MAKRSFDRENANTVASAFIVLVRSGTEVGSGRVEPDTYARRTSDMRRVVGPRSCSSSWLVAQPPSQRAGSAAAHPLGNFTVNRYAGIEVAGKDVYVRYALDLAEIPTYQLAGAVRKPGFPAKLADDLVLTLDGRRAPLRALERRVVTRPGAGGLETLRLDVVYVAEGASVGKELTFEDRAFPGRIGWREVTLASRDGARVLESSVPATSESDGLRSYPGDLLRSPLDVSGAVATIEPGGRRGEPPRIDARQPGPTRDSGGFEALIEQRRALPRRPARIAPDRRLLGSRPRADARVTGRPSSRPISSGRRARPGTRSCSAARSPSRTRPASSRSDS